MTRTHTLICSALLLLALGAALFAFGALSAPPVGAGRKRRGADSSDEDDTPDPTIYGEPVEDDDEDDGDEFDDDEDDEDDADEDDGDEYEDDDVDVSDIDAAIARVRTSEG